MNIINSFADLSQCVPPDKELHRICRDIDKYSISGLTGFNAESSAEFAYDYAWAVKNANLKPGMCVLDTGCGASNLPAYLQAIGMNVTAIDTEFTRYGWGQLERDEQKIDTQEINARLQEKYNIRVNYDFGDVCTYGKDQSNSFDRIFSISVLEHLGSLEKIIEAFRQEYALLKPGGWMLASIDYASLETKEKAFPGCPTFEDYYGQPLCILDENSLPTLFESIEGKLELLGTSDFSSEAFNSSLSRTLLYRPELWYTAICLRLIKI